MLREYGIELYMTQLKYIVWGKCTNSAEEPSRGPYSRIFLFKARHRISHTVPGSEGADTVVPVPGPDTGSATQSPGPLLGSVAPCLHVSCGSKPVGYEIKSVLSQTCGCTYSMPGETHNEPVLIWLGQTLHSMCTK